MSKKLTTQSTIALNGLSREVSCILHEAIFQAKNHKNEETREAFERFLQFSIGLIDSEMMSTKMAIQSNIKKYPEIANLLGGGCFDEESDLQ